MVLTSIAELAIFPGSHLRWYATSARIQCAYLFGQDNLLNKIIAILVVRLTKIYLSFVHLGIYINVTGTGSVIHDVRRSDTDIFFTDSHTRAFASYIYRRNYRVFPVRLLMGKRFKRFIRDDLEKTACARAHTYTQSLVSRNYYRHILDAKRMSFAIILLSDV